MIPSLSRAAFFACLALAPLASAAPQPLTIEIQADRPGAAIAPTLYGAFFEDINFGADGGLSAELVKNGSFEFTDPIMGWGKIESAGAVGGISIRTNEPRYRNNPTHARIIVRQTGEGFGLRNEGYRGIGVKQGERHRFSADFRLVDGPPRTLRIELVDPKNQVLATAKIDLTSKTWTRLETELIPTATEPKAQLRILTDQPGAFDIEAVSLMPVSTWKIRRNGLRADLVQLLADLKPGFLRFPGGCIVEGRTLPSRYQWKNTIGPVEERKLTINRWNVEFANRGRGAADYFQSFRLGFFEYFELCEDIGAEPLPIINCGMACQYNSGECVPLDELAPYIQDALDLIEFANGPVTSEWGRRRAEMGHAAPFGLKTLGIGNEQWGPLYFERYEKFSAALRARHPEIRLVASAGPGAENEHFKFAWEKIRAMRDRPEIVDEHCYAKPEWFLNNTRRYDDYDRTSPKVFMGEYAARTDTPNTWETALAEAAFMIGMERNADIVTMTAYAPLFAHADAWQWTPNLIWFDNLRVYRTPNYHVQQLFSLNRGDNLLPVKITSASLAENGQPRLYATASYAQQSGEIILKIVNATNLATPATISIPGRSTTPIEARIITLSSADLSAQNSFEAPNTLSPHEQRVPLTSPSFSHTIPAFSFVILRIPAAP